MIHPLHLYGQGLADAAAEPTDSLRLRLQDGSLLPLPLHRYLGPADEVDERLLGDLRGPVLDVGCGPGRMLHALAARGVFALGVDLSPVAVQLVTGRGARALVASIFDELPGAGAWRSALLLDGNIGIGGNPVRLMKRIRSLLGEEGELLVELEPPEVSSGQALVKLEARGRASSPFPWARVSVRDIELVANASGFRIRRRTLLGGRWFAWLAPIAR